MSAWWQQATNAVVAAVPADGNGYPSVPGFGSLARVGSFTINVSNTVGAVIDPVTLQVTNPGTTSTATYTVHEFVDTKYTPARGFCAAILRTNYSYTAHDGKAITGGLLGILFYQQPTSGPDAWVSSMQAYLNAHDCLFYASPTAAGLTALEQSFGIA